MLNYIIRRILYAVPIIIGVLIITFILFFHVFSPRHIAVQILGEKARPAAIQNWIEQHDLDKPYYFNPEAEGAGILTDTLLFKHVTGMLAFSFGNSFSDEKPISAKLKKRAVPSLLITLPIFVCGLVISISLSLFFAFFRGTYIDRTGMFFSVLLMSVSILIYIIFLQWLLSSAWHLFPVSGWSSGLHVVHFMVLPFIIGITGALGGEIRFYRIIMLEETSKEYIRTARAKGVKESAILFKHILKNALIPILTNTVMRIPYLFIGSLLLENFFGIPGLGSFTITAFQNGDFQSLKAIVFLGAVLYQVGIILTDISYSLADPRVVFE